MKKRFIILVLVLVTLLALAACQGVQPPASPNLAGTNWILSSLDGSLPLPGVTVSLQFGDDGTAGGSDGCNSYSTTYALNGTDLTFGQPMGATAMACPEPVMDQANTYMQTLATTNSFDVDGAQLTLRNGRKTLATFVADSQSLAGTTWQVISYNNGRGGVVSVIIGSQITADFSADEITGNAGCNTYFAAYLTEGANLTIGPAGTTMMACDSPPGVMEQEQEYLAALASVASFSIEGERMRMQTADGATAVQLERERGLTVPEPEPGKPTGRVTATGGANIRSGPATNYPLLGVAPFGAEGEIVGRSPDGQWWAVALPSAPGAIGWVSTSIVAAVNVEDVPVIQPEPPAYVPPAPATPADPPTPVPPPTATPSPELAFWADQTTINQGECTNINWSVENVQAVWVYPQGESYDRYPRAGQGNEQVCPSSTTTYEMRVLLRNGEVVTQQVQIGVNAQNPLADTSWEVISYNNGRGGVVSVIIDTRITANFGADNQVTGSGSCNDYFGSYQVSGNNISVGPLSSAQMACGEPAGVMEQEAEYLTALQSANTFRLDGNRLELRAADGTTAVTLSR